MGRANILSNGYTIKPLVETIEHRDELIADDVRLFNGSLQRVFRAKKHSIRYECDNLNETDLMTWVNAHPLHQAYSHTDELDITRTVVTTLFEYTAETQDTPTSRRYYVTVEVTEV